MRRLAAASLALVAAGCAANTSYLAKVNDETITGKDLRFEFSRRHAAMEKILGDEQDVRKFLGRLVDKRLFVQEGYRIGLHESADVREGVEKLRTTKITEAFLKAEIDDRSKVTEEEIRAVHAGLKESLQVRQVVVATEEEARAVAAELAKGADLERLARERSIAPSAKNGGMQAMGWGMDEAYERVLFPLAEGEVSPVFRSGAGWEVARVEKRNVFEKAPIYEKVAGQIRQVLQRRKRAAAEEALYGGLWAKYEVRALECIPTLAGLAAAAQDTSTACGTWKTGTLTAAAVAARVDAAKVAGRDADWPELRGALVADLLNREVVKLEADAQGYGLRPEIVAEVKGRQDMLVESKLYREVVVREVAVTDEDARKFYEANPGPFTEDAQLEVAQIVVDTLERAKEVEAKVRSRQPFAELVKAYSLDKDSVKEGGNIGWFGRKQFVDETAVVLTLAEGEVSPPIKTDAGYHLVKVLGSKPERLKPYAEVEQLAIKLALEERQKAAVDHWVKTLRAAAKLEINDAGIRAYSKEAAELLRQERAKEAAEKAAAAEKDAAEKAALEKAKADAEKAPPAAGAAETPAPTGAPAPAPAPVPAG